MFVLLSACLIIVLCLAFLLAASEPSSPKIEDSSGSIAADTTGIRSPETIRLAREENLRSISRERAAIKDAMAVLQIYTENLNTQRETLTGAIQLRKNAYENLRKASISSNPESFEADLLYDRLVRELQNARAEVAISLKAFRTTPSPPRYRGEHAVVIPMDENQRAALHAIAEQLQILDLNADKAAHTAQDLAWDRLHATMQWAEQLNDLRLAHLKKVSPLKRQEILGWGRSGIAQLRREWNHLVLLLDCTAAGRKRIMLEQFASLKDPYQAGALATQLILLAGLIMLYNLARRKGRSVLSKIQGAFTELTHSPMLARHAKPIFSIVDAMFDELCLLAAVIIAPALIGISAEHKMVYAGYAIVVWYAVYRLVTRAVYRGLVWKISIARRTMPAEMAQKTARSVFWAGRYVLAVAVILVCSSAILGKGYLYHIVTRLAWIGAIPICALLMRWWRSDIADTYLRLNPEGGLAKTVQATRAYWYGFFVTVAAFSVLLADAMAKIARRFIFGFEQSQRMLAYIFRKKLERASQTAPEVVQSRASIPPEMHAYFDEGPTSTENLLIDYFPGMSHLHDEIDLWHHGGKIGAVALIGETGCGKTTWLRQALNRLPLPSGRYMQIDHRLTSSVDMLALLAEACGAPREQAYDAATLGVWLSSSEEPMTVILDDLHFGFLRGVDTLDGFQTFSEVVEHAGEKVFWIASFAAQPFAFLHWVMRGNLVFRRSIRLPSWTEEAIGQLLDKRTTASGLRVSFDDLIVESVPGTGAETQLVSTIRDYNRLIWDMGLGSPRSALRFWTRSLVPDGSDSARVIFFTLPETRILENLGEVERFVLAGIIWHDRARIEEVAESLRYPLAWCRDAVTRLSEAGILAAVDGYFRVTPLWWPETIRYLRRKHLVGA